MKNWRKNFAVIVLLLLPLQGLAATLSAFSCVRDAAYQGAALGAHDHASGFSHEHDGDAGTDHSGHLTCHHFYSGLPTVVTIAAPAELPAFESSISLLFTLFVPERPQRPPRV